jgi:hypothetical protein
MSKAGREQTIPVHSGPPSGFRTVGAQLWTMPSLGAELLQGLNAVIRDVDLCNGTPSVLPGLKYVS